MRQFSISLSDRIDPSTKIKVYELERNGVNLLEEFVRDIRNQKELLSDFARAVRIIEETSNFRRYPESKFRKIKSNEKRCQIYEAKAGKIRVYLFHEKNTGRIIVTGGLKKRQKRDINRITSMIRDYYDEQGK